MDPAAAEWAAAPEETLALQQTPWASQPSEYAQNAWRYRPYGETGAVRVAAAHNGEALFFRLSWQDETKDDAIRDTVSRDSDGIAVTGGSLSAAGSYESGRWRVVISRPFAVQGQDLAALNPGQTGKVGFAVWQGSNQERAGVKATTPDWQPLEIQE